MKVGVLSLKNTVAADFADICLTVLSLRFAEASQQEKGAAGGSSRNPALAARSDLAVFRIQKGLLL